MVLKNKVQVLIQGKILTLMGTESEEYMKKIASYIDNKMDEIRKSDNSKGISAGLASVLTSINVADDYFKELEKNILLEQQLMEIKESGKLSSSEELAELQRLRLEVQELQEKNRLLAEENTALQTDQPKADVSHADLKKQIAHLASENQTLKNSANAAVEYKKLNVQLSEEIISLKKERALASTNIIELKKQLGALSKEKAAAKAEKTNTAEALSKSKRQASALMEENQSLKKRLDAVTEEKNRLIQKNAGIEIEFQKTREMLETVKAEKLELSSRIFDLDKQVSDYTENPDIAELNKKIEALTKRQQELIEEKESIQSEYDKFVNGKGHSSSYRLRGKIHRK